MTAIQGATVSFEVDLRFCALQLQCLKNIISMNISSDWFTSFSSREKNMVCAFDRRPIAAPGG